MPTSPFRFALALATHAIAGAVAASDRRILGGFAGDGPVAHRRRDIKWTAPTRLSAPHLAMCGWRFRLLWFSTLFVKRTVRGRVDKLRQLMQRLGRRSCICLVTHATKDVQHGAVQLRFVRVAVVSLRGSSERNGTAAFRIGHIGHTWHCVDGVAFVTLVRDSKPAEMVSSQRNNARA